MVMLLKLQRKDLMKLNNDIIKRVMGPGFINLSELPTNGVMSDHHHLNKKGHNYLYLRIEEFLEKL